MLSFPGLITLGPLRGKRSCLPASEYLSSYALFGHHGSAPANLEKLSQGQPWLPGLLDSIACCFASAEKVSPASHILEHTVPCSPSLRGLCAASSVVPACPAWSLSAYIPVPQGSRNTAWWPGDFTGCACSWLPMPVPPSQGYQGCHLQAPPSSQNTSPTSQHCQKMLSTLAGLATTIVTDT